MFCSKCGTKLDDDAKFCPNCGEKITKEEAPVKTEEEAVGANEEKTEEAVKEEPVKEEPVKEETAEAGASEEEASGEKKKIDWKEYLTEKNVERFAPIAALMPLFMVVVVVVLGYILYHTVGLIPVGKAVVRTVMFLLRSVFVLLSLAATGGLVYEVVSHKDMNSIHSWVAPFGVALGFLSCLGISLGWGVFSWVCGIISVALGLEFVARIVIADQPMESKVDIQAAIATYKQYYELYKEKYPSTKEVEKKEASEDKIESKFDGSGAELLGYIIIASIVCTITCGIAAPWMICKIYKWRISHTVINGKRLTFTGCGSSLLGHWILWELLCIITCGIYGFFVHVAVRKWELEHTYIEGETITVDGNESTFDGGSLEYIGYSILASVLILVTCGLAYPWVMAMLQKWDTKHQIINNRRLEFTGTGLGFLGEFLIIAILSVITCGIYSAWGTVRLNKYIVRNTNFVD